MAIVSLWPSTWKGRQDGNPTVILEGSNHCRIHGQPIPWSSQLPPGSIIIWYLIELLFEWMLQKLE